MSCPETNELVDPWIDKILTQYRESPKLLYLLRTYLLQIEDAYRTICDLPEKFNLNTAVGDQLTIIGKWLGWPRCHCVCVAKPVFGFTCAIDVSPYPIVGFCNEGTWRDCESTTPGEICISDDELYRSFLMVRIYQMEARFAMSDLQSALKILWGETSMVLYSKNGRVVVAPGRALTEIELSLVQLYPRILPVAPGIKTLIHFGEVPVAGFGKGWKGFCEPVFEDASFDPTGESDTLDPTGSGDIYSLGTLTQGAPWMCPVDVHPYDCTEITYG